MFKKTTYIAGIAMIVQSVTFLALFIMLITNKKSLTGAALAISAVSAAGGAFLAYKQVMEELSNERLHKAIENLSDLNQPMDEAEAEPKEKPFIPVDDTVNEDEFK